MAKTPLRQKSALVFSSKIDPDTNQRLRNIESELQNYYLSHQRLTTAHTQRPEQIMTSPSEKMLSKRPFDLMGDLNPSTVNVK